MPLDETQSTPEPPQEAPAEPIKPTEPISEPETEAVPEPQNTEPRAEKVVSSDQQTAQIPVNEPLTQNKYSLARELLTKARNAIQFRKRKKLDKIMALFDKKKNGSTSSPQVTNDEVEKLLHVSDATATRYLSILEKEGKVKQNGKTGKGVSYSRI